jgi:hypothetical protein
MALAATRRGQMTNEPTPYGRRAERFWARLRRDIWGKLSSGQAVRSTAVDGEGDSAEQVLEGPAAGEVKANTARGLANAGADFEELGAEGFDLGGAPGLRQLQAEQVDQVVSEAVQQQAEGRRIQTYQPFACSVGNKLTEGA